MMDSTGLLDDFPGRQKRIAVSPDYFGQRSYFVGENLVTNATMKTKDVPTDGRAAQNKHHLLNADGSYVTIFYSEPFGGTDAQYASFTQNETEQAEEARALNALGLLK